MTQNFNDNPEIALLPIDKDLLALLNRILDQNERILQLNERMLSAFELPRFVYHQPDIEAIKRHFR